MDGAKSKEETIAIFVFKHGCSACIDLKTKKYTAARTIYQEISSLYAAKHVEIKEYYYPDVPEWLKITKYYPTTILMPKRVYEKAEEIPAYLVYNEMTLMNGTILEQPNGSYKSSDPANKYGFLDPIDYVKFYNSYVAGGEDIGHNFSKPLRETVTPLSFSKSETTTQQKSQVCRTRIRPLYNK